MKARVQAALADEGAGADREEQEQGHEDDQDQESDEQDRKQGDEDEGDEEVGDEEAGGEEGDEEEGDEGEEGEGSEAKDGAYSWHFDMLNDMERNEKYQAAIQGVVTRALSQKKHVEVLDIGTGSGIHICMICDMRTCCGGKGGKGTGNKFCLRYLVGYVIVFFSVNSFVCGFRFFNLIRRTALDDGECGKVCQGVGHGDRSDARSSGARHHSKSISQYYGLMLFWVRHRHSRTRTSCFYSGEMRALHDTESPRESGHPGERIARQWAVGGGLPAHAAGRAKTIIGQESGGRARLCQGVWPPGA